MAVIFTAYQKHWRLTTVRLARSALTGGAMGVVSSFLWEYGPAMPGFTSLWNARIVEALSFVHNDGVALSTAGIVPSVSAITGGVYGAVLPRRKSRNASPEP